MSGYPIVLDIKGRTALIIGGGQVAFRKMENLVRGEARVTVISPNLHPSFKGYLERGEMTWIKRDYEEGDEETAFIVIAATDDKALNAIIAKRVSDHQLLNVVSQPSLGNFSSPALVTRGKLTIAIATEGASPLLTKRIKQELEERFEPEFDKYVDFLGQCRALIKNDQLKEQEKHLLLSALLEPIYHSEGEQKKVLDDYEGFKANYL
ncbi:NAD(P)-dependent oxidoreductase [Pullulanibacillus sp. KACC 23026]|uniref:precorrin-2 dehydrogenase/sirohydrochlorin ferrochelatase family protein n=1 Tax=Pullulanibacillus sp. KACC 23026 TaxID=3028315 RepID=UPI0023B0DFBC|nr:NAD(P)-dependent oxidoreductase [Pullulanibacillus sp. KACC 23026]WEG12993.1 NAD(P)-dependent oxidoreductase [Pullulanibacillus sp. KACC 23026]